MVVDFVATFGNYLMLASCHPFFVEVQNCWDNMLQNLERFFLFFIFFGRSKIFGRAIAPTLLHFEILCSLSIDELYAHGAPGWK